MWYLQILFLVVLCEVEVVFCIFIVEFRLFILGKVDVVDIGRIFGVLWLYIL